MVLSSAVQPHEHRAFGLGNRVGGSFPHRPTAICANEINVAIAVQVSMSQSFAVFVEPGANISGYCFDAGIIGV